MEAGTDPVGPFGRAFRRRLKFLTAMLILGDVAVAAVLIWFYFAAGSPALWWIPLYAVVILPASSVMLVWVMNRTAKRMTNFIETLRPRLRAAPSSTGPNGFWFLFDSGVVMNLGQQANVLSFRAFGTALGEPVRPNPDTAVSWGRALRLRGATTVTPKSGDPAVREGLERLRVALQARWTRVFLFERKSDSSARDGGPLWVLVFLAYLPRFTERGREVLNALDDLTNFMDQSLSTLVVERGRVASPIR